MEIFLDESGYTRDNLIDQHHPFMCFSTLALSESECRILKERFFQGVQAPVLKHKILSKTPRNQAAVLDFLAELSARPRVVKSYLVQKNFALACKFVDLLIEPYAHMQGVNLYEGGQSLAISCGVHSALAAIPAESGGTPVLQAFHNLLRERTSVETSKLAAEVERTMTSHGGSSLFNPVLQMLRHSEFPEYLSNLPNRLFDLSFTCALTLLSGWRSDLGETTPIQLIHDTSSVMSKESDWWEYLTAEDRSAFISDSTLPLIFPVNIDSTTFGREDEYVGLQLVDIVAGAIARAFTWAENGRSVDDDYGRRLMEVFSTHMTKFITVGMLPTKDIASIAHESKGVDVAPALSYIEMNMAKHQAKSQLPNE